MYPKHSPQRRTEPTDTLLRGQTKRLMGVSVRNLIHQTFYVCDICEEIIDSRAWYFFSPFFFLKFLLECFSMPCSVCFSLPRQEQGICLHLARSASSYTQVWPGRTEVKRDSLGNIDAASQHMRLRE